MLLYSVCLDTTAVAGRLVITLTTSSGQWLSTYIPQCVGLLLLCTPTWVQAPLATWSIWLFFKKTEAVEAPPPPLATVPLATLTPEPVLAAPEAASSTPASHIPLTTKAVPLDAGIAEASLLLQSNMIDTLAVLAPLQYGDLAALGLARWSPAGLATWILKLINVSVGLPWFQTIVTGTLLLHLLLLPFSIKQLHNSAALVPFQPWLVELKAELNKAYKTGDKLTVQRVTLKPASHI